MFPWALKPSHEQKGRGMSVVEDAAPVDAGGSHIDVISKLLGGVGGGRGSESWKSI